MNENAFGEYPHLDLERRECEHGFRAWCCPTRDCQGHAEVWEEYRSRAQERVEEIPSAGPYRTPAVVESPASRWTEEELDQISAVGQRQLFDSVADGHVQVIGVTVSTRRLKTVISVPVEELPPPPPHPTIIDRVRRFFSR